MESDSDGVGPTNMEKDLTDTCDATNQVGHQQNSLTGADLSEVADDGGPTDLEKGHQLSCMADHSLLHAEMRRFSIGSLADTQSPNANSTIREAVG